MAKKGASLAERLGAIVEGLNERQRTYLLAVYDEDQRRESIQRGPGSLPASTWRWIEYGAVGAKMLDSGWNLRRELEKVDLVSEGTGSTWEALRSRGLIETRHEHTGLVDAWSMKRIMSLMVQMTTNGRKVARLLRNEPMTRPKVSKPLSLIALRLIDFGQRHPDSHFDWRDPWPGYAPDLLVVRGVAVGLVKRGLLTGDPPHWLQITEAGKALDVTAEPNWRPMRTWNATEI